MRRATKLLALAVAAAAIAGAGAAMWRPGSSATRPPVIVDNDFCVVAPATPYDAASGLPMLAPRTAPADARCPVCGMYPARFPRWAAQAIFSDGAAQHFDSPVDLLVFLQRVERYNPSYAKEDVAASFVADAESGEWVASQTAFFVHGSSARGPMRGADLPAFATREQAATFARRHGGRILTLAEVTPDLLRQLSNNRRHQH